MQAAQALLADLQRVIITPLMVLMMSVALMVFLWGAFEYVKGADNDTSREEGSRHMMYGIIGLLIMASAYAILKIAAGTFDVPV